MLINEDGEDSVALAVLEVKAIDALELEPVG